MYKWIEYALKIQARSALKMYKIMHKIQKYSLCEPLFNSYRSTMIYPSGRDLLVSASMIIYYLQSPVKPLAASVTRFNALYVKLYYDPLACLCVRAGGLVARPLFCPLFWCRCSLWSAHIAHNSTFVLYLYKGRKCPGWRCRADLLRLCFPLSLIRFRPSPCLYLRAACAFGYAFKCSCYSLRLLLCFYIRSCLLVCLAICV